MINLNTIITTDLLSNTLNNYQDMLQHPTTESVFVEIQRMDVLGEFNKRKFNEYEDFDYDTND